MSQLRRKPSSPLILRHLTSRHPFLSSLHAATHLRKQSKTKQTLPCRFWKHNIELGGIVWFSPACVGQGACSCSRDFHWGKRESNMVYLPLQMNTAGTLRWKEEPTGARTAVGKPWEGAGLSCFCVSIWDFSLLELLLHVYECKILLTYQG